MNHRRLAMALTAWVLCLACWVPLMGDTKPDEEPKKESKKKADRKQAPKLGTVAPLFKLKMLDSDKQVDMKGFHGKRPLILFYGSYT